MSELATVAEEFAAQGSRLPAAEVLAKASSLAPKGEPEAAKLAVRAAHLASMCPGAMTPPLMRLTSPLGPRETEIGVAAAGGMTSREIAHRFSLSVRTVDNHLASAFRKLGLHAREELR
jgi:DNA-binding NarL/FixJ family response regulator